MGKGEDAEDFDAFFRREYRALVGLALVLSGSREAAEDIAQEALLAAHRRWSEVATLDDPGAWVRRVVANQSVSWLRRRTREVRAMTRVGQRREATIEPFEPTDDAFWRAVRALPRRQAQCVALHYLDDASVADIATTLQIEPGTVRVHLHEGRRELGRVLGEQTEDDR